MAHGSVTNGARRITASHRNICAPLALAILLSASHAYCQAPRLGPATNSDASTPKVRRQASPPVPLQSHSDDASNTNSADALPPPSAPGATGSSSTSPSTKTGATQHHKSPPSLRTAKT